MEYCCCGRKATRRFRGVPKCDNCAEPSEIWYRNHPPAQGEVLFVPIAIKPKPGNTFQFWKNFNL
jgi:hypothetical protein